MEQSTGTQNISYAQQLVDEYYGNYEKVKPSEAELPNILGIFEFMLDKFYYHNGINLEPIKECEMTFNDYWNKYKKNLTDKEPIEIALDAWSAGINSKE